MTNTALRFAFVLSTIVATGCLGSEDTSTGSQSTIIQQDCAADTDCPSGFECEVEDTTSFCKSDDDHSDGTCPAGYELEVEHGQTFCKAHGGGDDDDTGSDDAGTGSGTCTTDADCGAGLECELEHGVSFCKPHSDN